MKTDETIGRLWGVSLLFGVLLPNVQENWESIPPALVSICFYL